MSRLHRFATTLPFLAALLLSLGIAAPAFAQSQSERLQKMSDRFNAADTNHDGKLSLAEAQSGMPRVAQYFTQIDSTHSGFITFEQLVSFIQSKRGS